MKIPDHEKTPLIKKRKIPKPRGAPINPDSLPQRCKRAGTKLHPDTVRSRMERGDTFEEAISYPAMTPRESGQCRKKNLERPDGTNRNF